MQLVAREGTSHANLFFIHIERAAQMEHTNVEITFIQETADEATGVQLRELNELQLALVGGGIADPVLS
jgi:hypothetical protein